MSVPGSVDAIRYARVLALFALVAALALILAGWGMLSLILDRDVISQPGVPLAAGIIMTAVPLGAMYIVLLVAGPRLARGRPAPAAMIALALALGGIALYGAIGWGVFVLGWADTFFGPFCWWLGIVLAIVWLLYRAMVMHRIHGADRPRWPWEEPGSP